MSKPFVLWRAPAMAFALCLIAGCLALPALADDDDDDDDDDRRDRYSQISDDQRAIRAAVARGQILPLPRLIAIVQKRVPGDIIEVEYDSDDNTYEFKVLARNGQVWDVEVNAKTGAIVEIEDD